MSWFRDNIYSLAITDIYSRNIKPLSNTRRYGISNRVTFQSVRRYQCHFYYIDNVYDSFPVEISGDISSTPTFIGWAGYATRRRVNLFAKAFTVKAICDEIYKFKKPETLNMYTDEKYVSLKSQARGRR